MARLEGVRDVLQEDQPQDDVLVLGGVHVGAQLVRCGPEFFLEAEGGAIGFVGGSASLCRGHQHSFG